MAFPQWELFSDKLESEYPVVGAEKSNVLVDPVPDLGKIDAPEKVCKFHSSALLSISPWSRAFFLLPLSHFLCGGIWLGMELEKEDDILIF